MRKLYVMSEAPHSQYNENYLIGILSEEKEGEYSFEYKFPNGFPKQYLKINEFPDVSKIYRDGAVKNFIQMFLPPKNRPDIDKFIKAAGLSVYDEWAMLKFAGSGGSRNVYLYEQIPKGAIIYE